MTKEKLAIKLAIDIMERNVNKYINHGIYEVSDADGAVHVEFGEAINILNGMLDQQSCEDAVSRKAVIKAVDAHTNEDGTLDDDISIILEDLPSATPIRPKGAWTAIDEEPHETWECDHCGFVIDCSGCVDPTEYRDTFKFCPRCGTEMVKAESVEV